MRPFALLSWVMVLVPTAACTHAVPPAGERDAHRAAKSLVGQLLLPPGQGSRGVEIVLTVADAAGQQRDVWLLFDEQGRFDHTLDGTPIRVSVSTGLRAELHRIDTAELPAADARGQMDVGAIDLRPKLARHRLLVVRASEGAQAGDVRMAMCFGLPPVGPFGERVALGSRQFPPIPLGSEVEWLLPHGATGVRFLVERPGPGGEWRGGRQQLFGPFAAAALPGELAVD